MSDLEIYLSRFEESPTAMTAIVLTAVLLTAWIVNFIIKRLLIRGLNRAIVETPYGKDKELNNHKIIPRLANVVPALIIMGGVELVPNLHETAVIIVQNICTAFIVLTLALAASALMDIINTIYSRRPEAKHKPIKGYIQVAKLLIFAVAVILIIAALVDRSPLILLSGLGAMAAVLMLIFQDTLLSLVASVQISSSDMVRVGDWIQMPQLNADGDVIDIALHTVKVQNWDKTITTIPIRKLITDSFINWRGMSESGGRRIKRAIFIDQNSITFLDDKERKRLRRFALLEEYLDRKEKEIAEWNKALGKKAAEVVNTRRITNIGSFRTYIDSYLRNHKMVHQGMTMIVRQLSPTSDGVPLEVYCFVNDTKWVVYEGVQSDIFDHLFSILPEFGLRVFQNPSGADMQAIGALANNKKAG